MGFETEFWYDQFLAKPGGTSVPTQWHQDEAYWGRNLDDKGITCWMPFHDVDVSNGCMHFIDGGHKDGVLPHARPEHIQSDLLVCEPDETRAVACPIQLGSVTFHHSKTPHMTTANTTLVVATDPDPAPSCSRVVRTRATTTRGRCGSTSSPVGRSDPERTR